MNQVQIIDAFNFAYKNKIALMHLKNGDAIELYYKFMTYLKGTDRFANPINALEFIKKNYAKQHDLYDSNGFSMITKMSTMEFLRQIMLYLYMLTKKKIRSHTYTTLKMQLSFLATMNANI